MLYHGQSSQILLNVYLIAYFRGPGELFVNMKWHLFAILLSMYQMQYVVIVDSGHLPR